MDVGRHSLNRSGYSRTLPACAEPKSESMTGQAAVLQAELDEKEKELSSGSGSLTAQVYFVGQH